MKTNPALPDMRKQFKEFLAGAPKDERMLLFHDWDADGITAAVVLQKALTRAGFTQILLAHPNRERNAWLPSNRERVRELRPERLFLLDLGIRQDPVLEGVPTCYIDHHRMEGSPVKGVAFSGYGMEPTPCTSVIAWELAGAIADVSDLAWVAAIGAISDLGDKAPFEVLELARAQHGVTCLKESTALVNAVRRSANPDPKLALDALSRVSGPRGFLESRDPAVEKMRRARREVQSAMNEARKAKPRFSGKIALIEIRSPCQIHPLIAQSWRAKLPDHMVIAANRDYLPGRVNFSARSSGSVKALEILRAADIGEGEGSYGEGHDHASGGTLPFDRWERLLEKLGFSLGAAGFNC